MNVDAWAPFCNSINKIDEFDVVGRNRERWRLIEKRLYTGVRFQLNAFHERIRMNKIAKKENRSPISVTTKKKQILDDVRARYSCEILKRLADEDAKISKRIDDLALEYLVEVNPDHIAESVFSDLDRLAVEDVWDNSGGTRDGYVDPNELASEMFEEALEPYIDELRKCQEMSMIEEAKLHCMGILKGIYKFEKEATTEFQDWAVDDPHDNFRHIFEEWVKRNKDPKDLEEMDEFIKKNCPEWYNDLKKSRQYLLR